MDYLRIFKRTFIENYTSDTITVVQTTALLIVACLLAFYIYFVYKMMTRKTFYSRTFNITLPAITITTAAIILSVQASVMISLGMVGALSIVRFRTAIKEPMDLCYLFWAIAVGICCGARIIEIAVSLTMIMTVALIVLDRVPVGKAPMLLIVYADIAEREPEIINVVKKYSKYLKIKTRNITNCGCDYIIEVNVADGYGLVCDMKVIEGIEKVSLVSHDGEVNF